MIDRDDKPLVRFRGPSATEKALLVATWTLAGAGALYILGAVGKLMLEGPWPR